VGQWVIEARSKLADQSLKVIEYHGGSRPRDVNMLANQDVVVTTYETLVSDMQGRSKKVQGEPNPLARIKWWRVVCDESHAVKDLSSKALKAVVNIQVLSLLLLVSRSLSSQHALQPLALCICCPHLRDDTCVLCRAIAGGPAQELQSTRTCATSPASSPHFRCSLSGRNLSRDTI
jgi:hypothetical protein